jgi:hypothetical protein
MMVFQVLYRHLAGLLDEGAQGVEADGGGLALGADVLEVMFQYHADGVLVAALPGGFQAISSWNAASAAR